MAKYAALVSSASYGAVTTGPRMTSSLADSAAIGGGQPRAAAISGR
jgi:hypothetical protein